jgi:ComF family protein
LALIDAPELRRFRVQSGFSGGAVFSSRSRATIADAGFSVARFLSRALFSLLFPEDCRICGRALREVSRIPVCPACLAEPRALDAEYFCVSCRTPFRNAFPLDADGRCALCRSGARGFDAAYCFGAYEGALRELIHLLKYGGVRTLAKPLGKMMGAALPLDERFDLIAPVPLHWRRRRQRGFNQSELLARQLARRTGIPVRRVLVRTRATAAQAGLSNSGRRRNVARAFRCPPRKARLAADKRILLIDDVMTTGSTATECAQALKRAGARRVALLTAARVDRRFETSPAALAAVAKGFPR